MADQLFVLGAGFNRELPLVRGLSAPLTKDFFRFILEAKAQGPWWLNLSPLFTYAKKRYDLSEDQLMHEPLNIEEVLSGIYLEIEESRNVSSERFNQLLTIRHTIEAAICNAFAMNDFFDPRDSRLSAYEWFAKYIHATRTNIITFNWDCFLETLIESVSGFDDSVLDYKTPPTPSSKRHKWTRSRAYGIEFSKVQSEMAGTPFYFRGDEYYTEENGLYDWSILKLHGSINWFIYLPYQIGNPIQPVRLTDEEKEAILLLSPSLRNELNFTLDDPKLLILKNIFVPPIQQKSSYLRFPAFRELWAKAHNLLSRTHELCIIGYSFPPTDFHVRELFLEVFSTHLLEKLTIVNPSQDAIKTAIKLTHCYGDVEIFDSFTRYIANTEGFENFP